MWPPMSGNTRAETKARTRTALLQAGVELFAEQGFDGPSLDTICERAGYTRGAFYVHFRDRDDFAVAVLEQILGLFLATIVETAEGADDLSRTVETFVALYAAGAEAGFPAARDPHLQMLLDGCRRSPEVRARFVLVVQGAFSRLEVIARQGQRAGTVRSDVAPAAVAQLLVALVLGVLAMDQTGVPHELAGVSGAVLTLLRPR